LPSKKNEGGKPRRRVCPGANASPANGAKPPALALEQRRPRRPNEGKTRRPRPYKINSVIKQQKEQAFDFDREVGPLLQFS
jgi:hypothetical protein